MCESKFFGRRAPTKSIRLFFSFNFKNSRLKIECVAVTVGDGGVRRRACDAKRRFFNKMNLNNLVSAEGEHYFR